VASKRLTTPQLAAVMAGNGLEFYDFLIFGFFAVQIGAVFFPSQDDTTRLLQTLAIFGVGFLTRPLGGVVIGPLGDRIGRKPAMLFCFGLMGFSILGMALTPSFAAIGWTAPVLVVIFRLLQGFALGGEVGPATAFLMEAAPAEKRGLYVSLQFATQQAAILVAGLVGVALSSLLPPQDLNQWGWRAAMLLGVAVVPFAIVMRRTLPETLELRPDAPRQELSRAHLWLALVTIAMLASATIATFVMTYVNIFATQTLGLSSSVAFGAVVVTGACGVIFNPIGGMLSDRIGRKPVMITAAGLLCLVSIPCFLLMSALRTPLALYAGTALMSVLLALSLPSIMCSLSESLPQEMRSGGIGIIYAVAISTFGGTAQFVVAWLTAVSGSPLAPAWYMCAALLVGLCGMLLTRETAPIKLK
jgi:MHS family citrate/tricarballylate:H+ symporter-like MFS transporter